MGVENEQQELANVVRCKLSEFSFTYLGLHLSNKSLQKPAYMPLIQKMSTHLVGWAAKHISIARTIILINAMLTAIPIYYMTCLKLSKWVINKMDKIRRTFLWHGVSAEPKKMSLVNWSTICSPKEHGGLGVMDLEMFN